MCSLCIALLRGPPIGGQDSDGASYRYSAPYTLCLFEAFPSRGNEKIGGTGYCVTYDTDSQSRNVLASPLGEEGHKVAKGVQANWIHRGAPRPANPVRRHPAKSVWTVVILIMILDVDVTAAGVSKGEAAPFFYMTVCCSPTPSSRAEMHVGMGQMENALMIL